MRWDKTFFQWGGESKLFQKYMGGGDGRPQSVYGTFPNICILWEKGGTSLSKIFFWGGRGCRPTWIFLVFFGGEKMEDPKNARGGDG